MIILDFESNPANIHDVIEVAAFRVEFENREYKVVDILVNSRHKG